VKRKIQFLLATRERLSGTHPIRTLFLSLIITLDSGNSARLTSHITVQCVLCRKSTEPFFFLSLHFVIYYLTGNSEIIVIYDFPNISSINASGFGSRPRNSCKLSSLDTHRQIHLYLERVQLLPATTRSQDTFPVAVSACGIERITLENCRIHVRRKH